jgi:hypothetical protein
MCSTMINKVVAMFRNKKGDYIPPKELKRWVNDIPDGELYEAYIRDDNTVWSASGRFSHSSGATSVSWQEFGSGKMNELVEKTMGKATLTEIREFIASAST